MGRKRTTFTEPNNAWLKAQVDYLRIRLEKAEKSGYSDLTLDEIKAKAKEGLE